MEHSTCPVCGEVFSAMAANGHVRRYCSDRCAQKAWWAQGKHVLVCAQCGQEFRAGRKSQKYCSHACAYAARRTVTGQQRTCEFCGKPFVTRRRGQKLCSTECEKKRRQRRPRICKNCGIEFVPKRADAVTFCSRDCAFDYRAKLAEERRRLLEEERRKQRIKTCKHCGKEFEGVAQQVYCSAECRYRASYVPARERNEFVAKQCKHCGKIFTTNFYAEAREFCSKECAKRHMRRNSKARRRVRLRRQYVAPVSLAEIYKRDGGICQLCGKKVSLRYKAPHPLSATLDHIIPLSRGGTHEPKNVQLAHWICNVKRGTGGSVQLRIMEVFGMGA